MAELYMTDQEIVRSYLQSTNKDRQIDILRELNVCRRKTIIAVLIKEGVYEYPKDANGNPIPIKRGGRHRNIEEYDALFMPLYLRGLNDGQIALETGVSTTTVLHWRGKRNLPSNWEPGWNGKQRDHVSSQAS